MLVPPDAADGRLRTTTASLDSSWSGSGTSRAAGQLPIPSATTWPSRPRPSRTVPGPGTVCSGQRSVRPGRPLACGFGRRLPAATVISRHQRRLDVSGSSFDLHALHHRRAWSNGCSVARTTASPGRHPAAGVREQPGPERRLRRLRDLERQPSDQSEEHAQDSIARRPCNGPRRLAFHDKGARHEKAGLFFCRRAESETGRGQDPSAVVSAAVVVVAASASIPASRATSGAM